MLHYRKFRNFWLMMLAINFVSTYYLWDGEGIARTKFENPVAATAFLAAYAYIGILFLPLIPIVVFWFFLIVWRQRRKEDRPTPFPRVSYVVCYGLFILLARLWERSISLS